MLCVMVVGIFAAYVVFHTHIVSVGSTNVYVYTITHTFINEILFFGFDSNTQTHCNCWKILQPHVLIYRYTQHQDLIPKVKFMNSRVSVGTKRNSHGYGREKKIESKRKTRYAYIYRYGWIWIIIIA